MNPNDLASILAELRALEKLRQKRQVAYDRARAKAKKLKKDLDEAADLEHKFIESLTAPLPLFEASGGSLDGAAASASTPGSSESILPSGR